MDRKSLSAAILGLAAAAILWLAIVSQAPSFGSFGIIRRDGSVVVADSDIVSYNASRHEMTLTAECAARLEADRFLEGAFTVVVDGEVVLTGTFVPPIISRSYPPNEVLITYPNFDLKYDVMKIQMGYPWTLPEAPVVEDSALVAYFSSTGRLMPKI